MCSWHAFFTHAIPRLSFVQGVQMTLQEAPWSCGLRMLKQALPGPYCQVSTQSLMSKPLPMAAHLLCRQGICMLMHSPSTLFSFEAGDRNAKVHQECNINLASQRKSLKNLCSVVQQASHCPHQACLAHIPLRARPKLACFVGQPEWAKTSS